MVFSDPMATGRGACRAGQWRPEIGGCPGREPGQAGEGTRLRGRGAGGAGLCGACPPGRNSLLKGTPAGRHRRDAGAGP